MTDNTLDKGDTRKCKKCGLVKPIILFTHYKRHGQKRWTWSCRECTANEKSAYYQSNRVKYLEYFKGYWQKTGKIKRKGYEKLNPHKLQAQSGESK